MHTRTERFCTTGTASRSPWWARERCAHGARGVRHAAAADASPSAADADAIEHTGARMPFFAAALSE